MKLGLVPAGFRDLVVERLKAFFQDRAEVLAAYLFGSASEDGAVVNDIDILLLPRAVDLGALLLLLTELDVALAEHLGLLGTDPVNLTPFDSTLGVPSGRTNTNICCEVAFLQPGVPRHGRC